MMPVEWWLAIHAIGAIVCLVAFVCYGVMTIILRRKIRRAARTWGAMIKR